MQAFKSPFGSECHDDPTLVSPMLLAAEFTARFDEAFQPAALGAGLKRLRSRASRWRLATDATNLIFDFRTNPKSMGLPWFPGEFWAMVSWDGARYSRRDDGTVSYFQYTTESENKELRVLAQAALAKAERQELAVPRPIRVSIERNLQACLESAARPPAPNWPQYSLFFVDADDATTWGAWFAQNIGLWIERFRAAPESLDAWCWRGPWKTLPRADDPPADGSSPSPIPDA